MGQGYLGENAKGPFAELRDAGPKRGGVQRAGTLTRQPRSWGYILSCHRRQARLPALLERASLAMTVLCLLALAGLWLWPGADFSLEVLGLKLALSVALGVTGLAFGHIAERGLSREVQVDLKRQQLRIVWRNRHSATRLQSVIGFSEIGSIFLRRASGLGRGAGKSVHLDLRFGRNGEVITLFEGREPVLRALWRDLNADLRPQGEPGANWAVPAPRREGRSVLSQALR